MYCQVIRVLKGQGDQWDNRARSRGVTASFSLNGIGLVPEEPPDLYQENEELKVCSCILQVLLDVLLYCDCMVPWGIYFNRFDFYRRRSRSWPGRLNSWKSFTWKWTTGMWSRKLADTLAHSLLPRFKVQWRKPAVYWRKPAVTIYKSIVNHPDP